MKYQCEKNTSHITESDKPLCMCPVKGCDGEVLRAPGNRDHRNQIVEGKLRIRILDAV